MRGHRVHAGGTGMSSLHAAVVNHVELFVFKRTEYRIEGKTTFFDEAEAGDIPKEVAYIAGLAHLLDGIAINI